MHEDELDLDVTTVRSLLREQLPAWADLPLSRVRSTGTVNAIFRLGDTRCVRLPLTSRWVDDLAREIRWLPRLATAVSIRIPRPLGVGRPSPLFPLPWAVFDWIPGEPYDERLVDEREAGRRLGAFVAELRALDPTGGPPAGRAPLASLDAITRASITASTEIDTVAAMAAWDAARQAPAWSGVPVWMHGDLMRPNVLVADGGVEAVIDFGATGVGDPASDVVPAWSVFGPAGRAAFRSALDVDDDTWERARGYALHQAAVIIPYYRTTNPDFAADAVRTIGQVLADRAP